MTDIDKLEPGPELDRLVAEEVMGIDLTGKRLDLPIRGVGCAPYSTDIAAAWEVVESDKWVLDDWGILAMDHIEYRYEVWDLTGWELETGLISRAKTAPHAICLAALKAVSDG